MTFCAIKDPDATLDYSIDWSEWLGAATISTSIWEAPAGITIDSDANDPTTTTAVISGGTLSETYEVTNRITTSNGLTDDRTIEFSIFNK